MPSTPTVDSTFNTRLRAAQDRNQSLLCVGLDPDLERIPAAFGSGVEAIVAFNRAIIDATSDLACCYKPNLGFYAAFGAEGVEALAQIRRDVPAHIPVLLDAKYGDINTTSVGYAKAAFETWGFDAVTVNAYLGLDSLVPFLEYRDRGIFVLAHTSNPGSTLLQDRVLAEGPNSHEETVALAVTRHAVEWNDTYGNVCLVVGATWPRQMAEIRALAPQLPILVPGVGAQEGDLGAAVTAGMDAEERGILVNASRAISYASSGEDAIDAARAVAQRLRDEMNACRSSMAAV
jgi:orotidine-5'-phosphate decarboxylase